MDRASGDVVITRFHHDAKLVLMPGAVGQGLTHFQDEGVVVSPCFFNSWTKQTASEKDFLNLRQQPAIFKDNAVWLVNKGQTQQ